jgi:hypothetical protein
MVIAFLWILLMWETGTFQFRARTRLPVGSYY